VIQLTPEQQAVCRKAVAYFGKRAQVLKVVEELRELAEELEAVVHDKHCMVKIIDERADVAVTLWQLDNVLIPAMEPHVQERIAFKVKRLEGRMNNA